MRDEGTDGQRATLGKSGSETASYLYDRIVRVFCFNSVVKTAEMTAVIQYILTSAQSLISQDHSNKSIITIFGLAGVFNISAKMGSYDKMEYRLFRRKYLQGCMAKLKEVSKQQQEKEQQPY